MRTSSFMLGKLGVLSVLILCGGEVGAQTTAEKTADKAADQAQKAADKTAKAADKAADAAGRAADKAAAATDKTAAKLEKGAARAGDATSDAWLTAKTKLALFADDRVSGAKINVATKAAVVTLRGKVETEQAKLAAAEVAHTIDGVVDVKNELQIVPAAQRKLVEAKDDSIVSTVKDKLGKDRRFKDAKIDVRSDAGVVTLSGEAPNLATCVSASEMASAVTGVRAVKNTVTSKPGL